MKKLNAVESAIKGGEEAFEEYGDAILEKFGQDLYGVVMELEEADRKEILKTIFVNGYLAGIRDTLLRANCVNETNNQHIN